MWALQIWAGVSMASGIRPGHFLVIGAEIQFLRSRFRGFCKTVRQEDDLSSQRRELIVLYQCLKRREFLARTVYLSALIGPYYEACRNRAVWPTELQNGIPHLETDE